MALSKLSRITSNAAATPASPHRGETVEIGSTDQTAARAIRQRLEHVVAGPHATIEQHFEPVADRVGNVRQHRNRAGSAVELAPAVIGHHDPVDAFLSGVLGVLHVEDALEHQLSLPAFADPIEVAPVQALVGIAGRPGAGLEHARRVAGLAAQVAVEIAERLALAHEDAHRPVRLGGDVPAIAQRQPWRHGQAVLDVGMALAAVGQIDGQKHRRASDRARAIDHRARKAAILEYVELVPDRPLHGRRHVLDRADRERGQAEFQTGGFRGARRQDLAIAVDKPGQAGRRDRDRHRDLLAQQGGRKIAFRGVHHDALAQPNGIEVGAVGAQRELVVGAAIDVFE
jgi:hypothetical protein